MAGPVKNPNADAGPETDLASRWLGGSVLAASDESFGEKENLLTPGRPRSSRGITGPAARSSTAGRPGGGAVLAMTGRSSASARRE